MRTGISYKSHYVNTVSYVKKNSQFDRLNFEVSCNLHEACAYTSPWMDLCESTFIMCMWLLSFKSDVCFHRTRLWFGFMFIPLFTVPPFSQSTYNSSMPPLHPCHSIILHFEVRCYGSNGTYQYGKVTATLQKHSVTSLLFLKKDSPGRSLLQYIPKTSFYFHYFFSKTIILGILCIRTKIYKRVAHKNDT
jgi:hypothetical protein